MKKRCVLSNTKLASMEKNNAQEHKQQTGFEIRSEADKEKDIFAHFPAAVESFSIVQ